MILNFYDTKSFVIDDLSYETDSEGKPVDIIIKANKATCDAISEYSSLGYNYDEESQSSLFARLDDFCLFGKDHFPVNKSKYVRKG